jgi:hypothetical protein
MIDAETGIRDSGPNGQAIGRDFWIPSVRGGFVEGSQLGVERVQGMLEHLSMSWC